VSRRAERRICIRTLDRLDAAGSSCVGAARSYERTAGVIAIESINDERGTSAAAETRRPLFRRVAEICSECSGATLDVEQFRNYSRCSSQPPRTATAPIRPQQQRHQRRTWRLLSHGSGSAGCLLGSHRPRPYNRFGDSVAAANGGSADAGLLTALRLIQQSTDAGEAALLSLLSRSSWLTGGGRPGRRRHSAAWPGRTGSRRRLGRRGWGHSAAGVSALRSRSRESVPFSPIGGCSSYPATNLIMLA
jgi:hypothetical protein